MVDPSILRIEAELVRLSHVFAYCMDFRDYGQLIELFTPDALFDRVTQVHRGHGEIRTAMAQRPANVITRHVCTNFYFEHNSADEVRGLIYNMSYHGTFETPDEAPVAFDGQGFLLEFRDRYVRTKLGWRFAERAARPVLADKNSVMMNVATWRPEKLS